MKATFEATGSRTIERAGFFPALDVCTVRYWTILDWLAIVRVQCCTRADDRPSDQSDQRAISL